MDAASANFAAEVGTPCLTRIDGTRPFVQQGEATEAVGVDSVVGLQQAHLRNVRVA